MGTDPRGNVSVPAVLVALLMSVALAAQSPQRATLTVVVTGVHPGKGKVRVGVWRASDTFLKGASFRRAVVVASAERVTVKFENIDPGQYAVNAYQDENDNGSLDTGFMGKPKEPYGFSNDARGTFGPPSFRAAAFDMSTQDRTITFAVK